MVIVADILTIALLWVAVVLITPHLSGWKKLAAVYRASGPPSGERFDFQPAKIGDLYFWGITIYRSADGIYLPPLPIVLFRQAPLFIPWSELRNPRETRLFLMPMHEFDVGSPSLGALQLRSAIVQQPSNSSNQSLQPTAGRSDE